MLLALCAAVPQPPPPPPPPGPRPAASYWASGSSVYTNAWAADGMAIPGAPVTDKHQEPIELKINGVSWSGLESSPCVLGGLEHHPVAQYMAFLKSNIATVVVNIETLRHFGSLVD